jgi:hypothetical protein
MFTSKSPATSISNHWITVKYKLKKRFPQSKKVYLLRFLLIIFTYAATIFFDLHYLGNKNTWNTFDKIRIKIYLKSVIYVGYITPPLGPLRMVHYSSVLGNAFLNKEIPDVSTLEFPRNMLMSTEGNTLESSNNASDSFNTKLIEHEKKALSRYKKLGYTNYTHDYPQFLSFGKYGFPLYDIWMVLITTNIVDGKPKTSYLVWGMGVTTDYKSESFFGEQLGLVGKITPLKWYNKLEKEGLAKGYWTLVTESPNTSEISYTKRYWPASKRKKFWLSETLQRHRNGHGTSAQEIVMNYKQ